MLSLRLKTSVALLLLGFVLGFCTPSLFQGWNEKTISKNAPIIQARDLKKQSEQIESKYQAKISELENRNSELEKELADTKTLLKQAKQKTTSTETKIKKLIEPKGFLAKELLKRVNQFPNADTAFSDCDSLVKEVDTYIKVNHQKDSLYETQIITMDSMLTAKDSIISIRETVSDNLHQFLNQALGNQQLLQKENIQLRKLFKRQKFKSKLITVGVMILSATATNYLLHK